MQNPPPTNDQESQSYVFLVRLWPGDVARANAGGGWHGKVQNIVRGEASTFAGLPALIDCLLALLPAGTEQAEGAAEEEKR